MKQKKRITPPRAKAKELAPKFQEGFGLLGIQVYPSYSNPHDFARRFEKCSVLIDTRLSTGAGTTPNSLLRKD